MTPSPYPYFDAGYDQLAGGVPHKHLDVGSSPTPAPEKVMSYRNSNKRQEYQKNWQKEKAHRLRAATIAHLGGECVRCGIRDSRVLQIDHIVPVRISNKKRVRQIPFYNAILIGEEINVQLLCANCHAIKTAEDFGY